ncbi:PREDICTED: transmembrane protein 65 [Galeopterus variegatus]|uniref:Transmembrane protein 65 n=1 Tax=Galeopterus variegatus TaxID=482537 RepID=A0ABM0Q3A4_GALVR|nr:PREDICTED: transmembrane protein 65 [Galeopterus variegatus]
MCDWITKWSLVVLAPQVPLGGAQGELTDRREFDSEKLSDNAGGLQLSPEGDGETWVPLVTGDKGKYKELRVVILGGEVPDQGSNTDYITEMTINTKYEYNQSKLPNMHLQGPRQQCVEVHVGHRPLVEFAPSLGQKLEAPPPTPGQLRYVFIHNAIPFIGFGFLDNAIMIVAGTHIELSIGIILGISTMAAAALGNLVSDLAGLGLAGYVEALASRLGLSIPDLTPKQVDMWQTRVSAHLGKAVGVTIGCILGMFPLIFFGGGEEDEKLEKKN